MTAPDHTRRELVRGGLAASGAVALAATVPLLDPPGALAAPADDAAVLASLLRVEQVIVVAYERALATGVLSAAAQRLLASFLDQERAHVHALASDLGGAGGSLPAPPRTTPEFEAELRVLGVKRTPTELGDERQCVHFLVDLEMVMARRYRFAIARLESAKHLVIAAEIMANEAQHATTLRELLSPGHFKRAVPTAFVAGSSQ